MEKKTFNPGDQIELTTKDRTWTGHALESHDPEIILLKLSNGYNIGIRESEIMKAKVLQPYAKEKKSKEKSSINKSLPNVAVIITGGTISSRLDPKSGGVISTDKEEMLNIAPELREICNPIVLSPFMKFSEDMSYADWKILAEECGKLLTDDSISGIIITHGTDFIHYTAAALHYFIRDLNKPIALTYSQKSIDRASTDANLNLVAAAKYATSDIAEVALVGHGSTSDDYCLALPGKSARKLHTSARDAFKIINDTPLAKITKDSFEILRDFSPRNSGTPKIDTAFQEKVAIIKASPGSDPEIINFYKNLGYKGLVIEVAGIGQVAGKLGKYNWIPKIKSAIKDEMILVATPQTINGLLNLNVYSAGRDLQKTGILVSKETTEATLIKLSWVLGHRQWNKIQKMEEDL